MNKQTKTTAEAQGERLLPGAHGSARSVQRISKFLRVVCDDSMPDERGVMSNDNKLIAVIGYYKPWREWVLYPEPRTVWSTDCLVAIKSHLAWMSKVVQGPNESSSETASSATETQSRRSLQRMVRAHRIMDTLEKTWRQPPPGTTIVTEGVVKKGDWFYIAQLGAWGLVPKSGWGEQINGATVARGTVEMEGVHVL